MLENERIEALRKSQDRKSDSSRKGKDDISPSWDNIVKRYEGS